MKQSYYHHRFRKELDRLDIIKHGKNILRKVTKLKYTAH